MCSKFLVLIFIIYDTQEVYLCWKLCVVCYWRICTMWYTWDACLGITCRGLYAGEAQQCAVHKVPASAERMKSVR